MEWGLFRRETDDGGFEMVGVDTALLGDAPVTKLPVAVEIVVANSSVHPDVMVQTEAGIESATRQLGGRIAGTIRSTSSLWTLVHVPSDDGLRPLSQIPLPRTASLEVQPSIDPAWTIFDRVRPVGIEYQSMLDLAVLAGLHRAGDRGGVRRVDHVVTGLGSEARDRFVVAATSVLGSADVDVAIDEMGGTVTLSHRADPVDITPDAWTIRQIAERHGGEYDGWGCEVLAPSTERPAKKRWFRR